MRIPVTPVPASRPRVPRFGRPFYVGRYKTFRAEMDQWIDTQPPGDILECPLSATVEFACRTPANPANPYPIGDIDNYLKAIWDSLQGRLYFADDKQIHIVHAIKRFCGEQQPHIQLTLESDSDWK